LRFRFELELLQLSQAVTRDYHGKVAAEEDLLLSVPSDELDERRWIPPRLVRRRVDVITAVEVLTQRQSCPAGGWDSARITNGRFDLLTVGFGNVTVFLDMNGDGTYQKNEPDCRGKASITPADFDAEIDVHIDITEIPPQYASHFVNVAINRDGDSIDGSTDGEVCINIASSMGFTPGVFSIDNQVAPSCTSVTIRFIAPHTDPLDPSQPHFIGSLTKPPCVTDGDLTTCSLSFRDFVTGDGGTDGGDTGADRSNDSGSDVDGSL
jgi:hypothetical protein